MQKNSSRPLHYQLANKEKKEKRNKINDLENKKRLKS